MKDQFHKPHERKAFDVSEIPRNGGVNGKIPCLDIAFDEAKTGCRSLLNMVNRCHNHDAAASMTSSLLFP